MALLNYDHVSIGDKLKVSLSGDAGINLRGAAGTIVEGYVIEKSEDDRTVVLDAFLVGVGEEDEVVEHTRIAQTLRRGAIDQTGDS